MLSQTNRKWVSVAAIAVIAASVTIASPKRGHAADACESIAALTVAAVLTGFVLATAVGGVALTACHVVKGE